jgi:hypothetical protein
VALRPFANVRDDGHGPSLRRDCLLDEHLLEAARAGGLNPLSSCEEGFCASCAAKRIGAVAVGLLLHVVAWPLPVPAVLLVVVVLL